MIVFLSSLPEAVLAGRRSLADIDRSHRQAQLFAAVGDAETNRIDEDFTRPHVVGRPLVFSFDHAGCHHQVCAVPVLDRLQETIGLTLSKSRPVVAERT
jgi:hypothetical protein